MRICAGCSKPMTERGQPRVPGVRVFQARDRCSNCYQRALETGELLARNRVVSTETDIQCMKCERLLPKDKFKKHKSTLVGYEHVCRLCGKLFERYKITYQEYTDMWVSQEGICAICPDKIELNSKNTHIDHDHSCCNKGNSCGKCVRGLLCQRCNLGLGYFRDSIENLLSAAEYLRTVGNDPM